MHLLPLMAKQNEGDSKELFTPLYCVPVRRRSVGPKSDLHNVWSSTSIPDPGICGDERITLCHSFCVSQFWKWSEKEKESFWKGIFDVFEKFCQLSLQSDFCCVSVWFSPLKETCYKNSLCEGINFLIRISSCLPFENFLFSPHFLRFLFLDMILLVHSFLPLFKKFQIFYITIFNIHDQDNSEEKNYEFCEYENLKLVLNRWCVFPNFCPNLHVKPMFERMSRVVQVDRSNSVCLNHQSIFFVANDPTAPSKSLAASKLGFSFMKFALAFNCFGMEC